MAQRRPRNLRGRSNDSYILLQESVSYGVRNNSRYKHLDELTLFDGKTIKATMGPVDMSIFPNGKITPFSVPKHMENRIDLVALKFYGISSLYWVLCYMNGIVDPLSLPSGTILFIPDIQSLRTFPNPLS